MIVLEVGPALSLVAVGQVDEAESQGQKTSNAVRCVPRRRRTPHAAVGDHHLEEEEERAAIGAGSQVRRERKEIETAAIQKIEGNSALQSRERSICCSAD